jgi:GWxTD domain-containing protein
MKFLTLCGILILALNVLAEDNPQKTSPKFSMDFGRFRYDTTSVYLEIYYEVFPGNLDFQQTAEGQKTSCELKFELLNLQNDSLLAKDIIQVDFTKLAGEITTEVPGKVGLLKLIVPEGKYKVRLASPCDTVSQEVAVSPFKGRKIAMSDLQICSNIITGFKEKDHPFYKNTMKVIPHPSAIFGQNQPLIYYYVELYNLLPPAAGNNKDVLLQAVIADSEGKVRLTKEHVRTHQHESTVERGMFNIQKLESGLYTLIFAAMDSSQNVSVYRRSSFYVHNPNIIVIKPEDELDQSLVEEVAILSESQLDEMFAQSRYIATSSEANVYKVLNSVESKRTFMVKFWSSRNKEKPGFKDEYLKRVEYANLNFSQVGVKGWDTDMGRVYITYGSPSEYQRNPVNPNENAYEVWLYLEIEGGVEFDFVDINGYGIYQLVNSTKRGEVRFDNWMEEYVYSR